MKIQFLKITIYLALLMSQRHWQEIFCIEGTAIYL